MVGQTEQEESKRRVMRHRARAIAQGFRRVEVTVPEDDAGLVKSLASVLRAGGDDASQVRDAMTSITAVEPARTGAELVAFFSDSPLAGEELTFERDQSEGRTVDFE